MQKRLHPSDLPFGGQNTHDFTSQDRSWELKLNRDFIALICHSYTRWEDFRQRLKGPFEALTAQYRPSFFTRIGLRYRDVIRRSRLELEDKPWSELLQPWVSGALGSADATGDVENATATTLIRLPDDAGKTQVSFWLALDQENGENVFVIDADFFSPNNKRTLPMSSNDLTPFTDKLVCSSGGASRINFIKPCAPQSFPTLENNEAGRAVFLPGYQIRGGGTLCVGFHLFGTSGEIDVPEPVMNRVICHVLINCLRDRGLAEAVDSLSSMVDYYNEPLRALPALPEGKSFPARITGAYTEPVYAATED